MRRPAALFQVARLGVISVAPVGLNARRKTDREKCRTIGKPGSYNKALLLIAATSPHR
jgi:hypothetical protein